MVPASTSLSTGMPPLHQVALLWAMTTASQASTFAVVLRLRPIQNGPRFLERVGGGGMVHDTGSSLYPKPSLVRLFLWIPFYITKSQVTTFVPSLCSLNSRLYRSSTCVWKGNAVFTPLTSCHGLKRFKHASIILITYIMQMHP